VEHALQERRDDLAKEAQLRARVSIWDDSLIISIN
jgi:hypothetical protein